MTDITTEENLNNLINNNVEESLNLEYKSSKAIENTIEISKDVSAFANSAGGTIIYGIKEFEAKEKRHFPEMIDPGIE